MHPDHQVSQAKSCTESPLPADLSEQAPCTCVWQAGTHQGSYWCSKAGWERKTLRKHTLNVLLQIFIHIFWEKRNPKETPDCLLHCPMNNPKTDRSVQQHCWGSKVDVLLTTVSSARALTPQYRQHLVSGFKTLFCSARGPSLRTKTAMFLLLTQSYPFLLPTSFSHRKHFKIWLQSHLSIYFACFWNTRNQLML